MNEYLQGNQDYWSKGYVAENVESFVFRPYGRILKWEMGLDGSKHEKMLDFGCGEGAALNFFHSKGFDVYGVDISEVDINRCKKRMEKIDEHFLVIDPCPKREDQWFGGEFDVVIAIQSLYYYSNSDLQIRLQSLYEQMKPGAIIYASMMGPKHYMHDYATPWKDGLSKVEFDTPRLSVKNYFINFTYSEDELVSKFSMFKRKHVGFYDAKYRDDEGGSFHWTFVGQK